MENEIEISFGLNRGMDSILNQELIFKYVEHSFGPSVAVQTKLREGFKKKSNWNFPIRGGGVTEGSCCFK